MHECGGTKGRLTRVTCVSEPSGMIAKRYCISGRQFHEHVVWMLPIDQRLAFVSLTGLKQKWRTSWWKSKRFKAEQPPKFQQANSNSAKRGRHEPICRLDFCCPPRATL